MAAPGSLSPLSSPATPTSPLRLNTPSAVKLKTHFLYRHAQESEHASTTPTPPKPRVTSPPHRLDTPPTPKSSSVTLFPTSVLASPPNSPAPSPLSAEDARGVTRIPPFSPLPFSFSPFTYSSLPDPAHFSPHAHTNARPHITSEGLDLTVRHLSQPTWHTPTPTPTPQARPLHPAHRLYHHHHHRHLHHAHHRHAHMRHRPRPICITGGEGPIMVSEAPMKRSHLDAFANTIPTASHKAFHLDTTQQDSNEYKKKPLSKWKYHDVVSCFLDGRKKDIDFDFNFNAISGVDGPELARLPRETFLTFSPKYGHELYEEVQRLARQERASIYQTTTTATSPSPLSTSPTTITTSSSSSLISPPYILTTAPHPPLSPFLAPQPSVRCDAQAPYELRIEPPPQQSPLRFPRGAGGVSRFDITPTAALKSVPPPLMALDSVGREVNAEGDSSRGVSGGEPGQRQEEVKVEPPKKRGPGRPKKPENELKKKKKKTGRLWEFIRNLLLNPETCPSLVRWEDAEQGMFRFMDGEKVAKRWGDRKNNKDMNYEKLSRAMRYYYKTKIFEAVIGRRLVYKFGKKATGWRTSNPNFTDIHQNLPTTSPQDPPPSQPPPQQSQPQPAHHHTNSRSQLHRYTDTTTPQLHTDSNLHLHHHSDLHHTSATPQQRHQSEFLTSPPQISIPDTSPSQSSQHHQHQHLQGLSLHHLHLSHHQPHLHHTT